MMSKPNAIFLIPVLGSIYGYMKPVILKKNKTAYHAGVFVQSATAGAIVAIISHFFR